MRVPPASLKLGHDVRVPLCLCFIDLQNAYHSVDRSLLWQILSRYGVPRWIIAAIRQFREGMRACVRNDNGDCSEELSVEQRLRQGCVLSSLLFNIFFAAALQVTRQRFSDDPDILADLVHLREQPAKVGPETAMECVRHAVWGMLYLSLIHI